jgi:hypothetical protein
VVSNWFGGRDTRYSDEDLALTLPGKWTEAHERTHLAFERAEERDQLTLVANRAKHPLDTPTLFLAVLDLVRLRQEAFRSLSGAHITFSDLETQQADGKVDVTFMVADPSQPLQARVTVLGRPGRVVSITYSRYLAAEPPSDFMARSNAIVSRLTVRS